MWKEIMKNDMNEWNECLSNKTTNEYFKYIEYAETMNLILNIGKILSVIMLIIVTVILLLNKIWRIIGKLDSENSDVPFSLLGRPFPYFPFPY